MNPILATLSSSSSARFLALPSSKPLRIRACDAKIDSVAVSKPNTKNRSFAGKLQYFSKTVVLVGAAALMIGKVSNFPAKADSAPTMVEQEPAFQEEKEADEKTQESKKKKTSPLLSPMIAEEDVFLKEKEGEKTHDPKPKQTPLLSEFLESDEDVIEAMKSLIHQKIENYEDEEALSILSRLVSAQPNVTDWKFLFGRLLGDIGQTEKARKVFEEILQSNPFSYETLFENALLMDSCGEGEAVFKRLEKVLALARKENKVNAARDVRFIMAYLHFLHNNVELALMSYQELAEEDPSDCNPYFCRGVIYTTLDMNDEAEEQFLKYDKLKSKKHQVEGHRSRRTPSSKTRTVRLRRGE